MEINEIKKDLYKSKAMAKFSHYVSGKLYYNIETLGGTYQFQIHTVEETDVSVDFSISGSELANFNFGRCIPTLNLSEDLGTTSFSSEVRGSELIRWISKAVDNKEFIKVA